MTLSALAVHKAIENGSLFLNGSQLAHGEFYTMASPHRDLSEAVYDQSAFPTAMIAYSIGFLSESQAQPMLRRALGFLLREMHAPGFWSYWGISNPKQLPIDTDTTSNALVALRQKGIVVPENKERLLLNRDEQGRFYTWLLDEGLNSVGGDYVPFSDYPNVHPVINANVLALLGESVATSAAIDWVLEWYAPANRDSAFPWYTSRLCLHYSVSRAFFQGIGRFIEARDYATDEISREMLADDTWSALQQAQAACCLLNYSTYPEQLWMLINSIVARQKQDGSWPATAMYDGANCYYGSRELTTAFCLEALSRSLPLV